MHQIHGGLLGMSTPGWPPPLRAFRGPRQHFQRFELHDHQLQPSDGVDVSIRQRLQLRLQHRPRRQWRVWRRRRGSQKSWQTADFLATEERSRRQWVSVERHQVLPGSSERLRWLRDACRVRGHQSSAGRPALRLLRPVCRTASVGHARGMSVWVGRARRNGGWVGGGGGGALSAYAPSLQRERERGGGGGVGSILSLEQKWEGEGCIYKDTTSNCHHHTMSPWFLTCSYWDSFVIHLQFQLNSRYGHKLSPLPLLRNRFVFSTTPLLSPVLYTLCNESYSNNQKDRL